MITCGYFYSTSFEYILCIFFSFLRLFVDECDRIVSFKLKLAEKNAKKSQDNFEAALTEVLELEKI